MIVQSPLIWRPENIICNMASELLIGQSNYCLALPLILPSTFGRRSSLRSWASEGIIFRRDRGFSLLSDVCLSVSSGLQATVFMILMRLGTRTPSFLTPILSRVKFALATVFNEF